MRARQNLSHSLCFFFDSDSCKHYRTVPGRRACDERAGCAPFTARDHKWSDVSRERECDTRTRPGHHAANGGDVSGCVRCCASAARLRYLVNRVCDEDDDLGRWIHPSQVREGLVRRRAGVQRELHGLGDGRVLVHFDERDAPTSARARPIVHATHAQQRLQRQLCSLWDGRLMMMMVMMCLFRVPWNGVCGRSSVPSAERRMVGPPPRCAAMARCVVSVQVPTAHRR